MPVTLSELTDAEASTIDRPHPDRGRLHALLLRADPLPLDRLRRPDPAEARRATGSPPTSPRRPSSRVESDVRIGGVSVGKVKELELAPADERVNGKDTTEAVIEIEPEFAPISEDARAILRQKTLLGETYVELTSGTEPGDAGGAGLARAPPANVSDAEAERSSRSPRAARSASAGPRRRPRSTRSSTPSTRRRGRSFQRWQANAAVAIEGRGLDLNDSLGNLGPFLTDASDVSTILDAPEGGAQGARPRHRHASSRR